MKPCLVVLILALTVPLVAQGDRALTEALAERATQRLQALHQEADSLAAEARTLLGDLRRLEVDRQIRTEELRTVDREVAAVSGELEALNADLQRLEEREKAERPWLRARLVELYKLGRGSHLRLWLSTSDARGLTQASRIVAALARRDRERLEAHRQRREEFVTTRVTLNERNARLGALRTETERARAAAARAVSRRNALIRDLDSRRDLNAQLAGELQVAQQKLQGTLRGLATNGPSVAAVFLPLAAFRGELGWPVADSDLQRARAASNGVEIPATEGTPVRAVHDGIVAFADAFTGFGRLVILDHGDQSFSLYGNLLDVNVSPGARVEGGTPIGSVGPSVTGTTSLYFELRVDGQTVDPLQWLRSR